MKYKNTSPHGVYVPIGGSPVFVPAGQEIETDDVVAHPHIHKIEEEKVVEKVEETPAPVAKKETKKKVTSKKSDK